MERDLDSLSLKEFLSKYPAAIDFLISYKLTELDLDLKFIDALERYESETLNEMGLNAFDIYDLLLSFLSSGSSGTSLVYKGLSLPCSSVHSLLASI